jgi:hypothetical protein
MMTIDATKKLATFITENMHKPFDWGRWDCCLFACDCVKAMTGVDPGFAFRERYSTAKGAQKALKKVGHGDIESTFSHYFGPVKPRLNASQTDLVLLDTTLGDAVGVVTGAGVFCTGENGLVRMPLSAIKGCWKVRDYIESKEQI